MGLIGEDRGHEAIALRIAGRVALELGIHIEANPFGSRSPGDSGVLAELRQFRPRRQLMSFPLPDVLMVLLDANSHGLVARRRQVETALGEGAVPRLVLGCPEPHVERWLFADVGALGRVVGGPVQMPDTTDWKSALDAVVSDHDVFIVRDSLEIASDVVMAMDFLVAERTDPSFGRFVRDLRAALRSFDP